MDIDHSLFQSGQAIYPCTSPLYTSLNHYAVIALATELLAYNQGFSKQENCLENLWSQ